MEKTVTRIVAYGCSWTAGSEIMDHTGMGISFDECNAIKKTYIKSNNSYAGMQKFYNTYNITEQNESNYNNSWAGQIANKLNKPLDNRAIPGSGIDQIYFTLIRDYHAGRILPTDLVLVGLTTIYRLIKFDEELHSLSLSHINDTGLIDLCNDDFIVYNYFKTLGLLASLKKHMNIRLQPIVPDINPYNESFQLQFNLSHTTDYAHGVWNDIKDVMIAPDDYIENHLVGLISIRCGFGHHPMESHTKLVEKIFKHINI